MKVALFARVAKVQCWITSCNVQRPQTCLLETKLANVHAYGKIACLAIK